MFARPLLHDQPQKCLKTVGSTLTLVIGLTSHPILPRGWLNRNLPSLRSSWWYSAGGDHIATSFSCIPIRYVLFDIDGLLQLKAP